MSTQATTVPARPSRILSIALWVVQGLLAAFFIFAGYTKLSTPIAQLSQMMPWTAEYPSLVTFTGLVDLAGGLGVILPALTRIQPRLGVFAALGLVVLQGLALAFHLSRGEMAVAPMNVILLALSLFVLWGRGKAAPIVSR